MALLDGSLDAVIRNDIDGLMLIPGRPPCLRRSGRLVEAGARRLDAALISELLAQVAPAGRVPNADVGTRWRFVYRRRGIDFEFSAALTPEGWSVAATPRVRAFRRPDAAGHGGRSVLAVGLESRLGEVLADDLGRRKFPRIPLRTEVRYTVDSVSFSAQISDLSESGAFVDTHSPLAAGSTLDFEFCLPGDPRPITGRARVVWRQEMVGMGIEFLAPPQMRVPPVAVAAGER
jgi:uncharacterized protein (TIGR02266 family)